MMGYVSVSHEPRAIINSSCLNCFGQRFGHNDIKVIDTSGIGPDCVHPTEAAWHAEGPVLARAPRSGLWELATLPTLRHTFPICKAMILQSSATHKSVVSGSFLAYS